MRNWPNVATTLGQRLRRWPNVVTTLGQYLVLIVNQADQPLVLEGLTYLLASLVIVHHDNNAVLSACYDTRWSQYNSQLNVFAVSGWQGQGV